MGSRPGVMASRGMASVIVRPDIGPPGLDGASVVAVGGIYQGRSTGRLLVTYSRPPCSLSTASMAVFPSARPSGV